MSHNFQASVKEGAKGGGREGGMVGWEGVREGRSEGKCKRMNRQTTCIHMSPLRIVG